MTPPLLRVEDLCVTYRDGLGRERRAVDGVYFSLDRGATLGIVGESGSGKSTLARAILGHGRPGSRFSSGRVLIEGKDVLAIDDAERRHLRGRTVAFVPQNPLQALTPHMTVGAQIEEALRRHRGLTGAPGREAALALLSAMKVIDPIAVARRYPHEVSGGQRQRVVIAAALAGEPDLLVLDEPTTALDKTTEAQVLDLVRDLRLRLGVGLVTVSHDLRMIASLTGRVLVMHQGRVIEDGPTGQILERPREAYTRDLVGALPHLATGPIRNAAPGTPILTAERLSFSYRKPGPIGFGAKPMGRAALTDVNLSLARGRTLGIVGESGSGKSTLGGLVAGLLAGHDGLLTFDGAPLAGAARYRPPEVRRRIQMIFQDPAASLNPRHRVGGIVARGFELFGGLSTAEARRRTGAMFERIGLEPALMDRLPGELSGGQQQRVAIARAFTADPHLVVCDEITSALDVTIEAQVLQLMRELQERDGVAYLFISHNLAVVSEMADGILVLKAGGVAAHGPTAQLLSSPDDGYTRALVAAFDNRRAA